MDKELQRLRWRLVLGAESESALGGLSDETSGRQDETLEFLYGREYAGRNVRSGAGSQGGSGDSQLTVPEWINTVHELFPQKTIERLEKDALERYQLQEIVTNAELLSRVEPNTTLLKAILQTKHLMNQEVLAIARTLVRRVVQQLMEKLSRPVQSPFIGSLNRQRRSMLKVAKNFDAPTTIRRNLAHYDPQSRRLFIQTPYFNSRIRRQVDRWQIIILIDESGSMINNVIHAAVTAAIFWGIPALRTHLCIFDTTVVDLTADCSDPVEILMKVQLGGGTDIGNALNYASGIIDNPRRTIVVLITDFYEGGPADQLLNVTKSLIESGVTLLGLAALDEIAQPNYDRQMAGRMVELGAHVAAMTPGELAAWVSEKVR